MKFSYKKREMLHGITYDMWHQNHCCETQEAQRLRVHSHRPAGTGSGDRNVQRLRATKQTSAQVHVSNPPVKEGGEDADTEDAGGQDVEDVGQEHLPLAIKAVLTLLIADGS